MLAILAVGFAAVQPAAAQDPDPDTRDGLKQIFHDGCAVDKNPARRTQCLCLASELSSNLSDGELRKFIWISMGNGLIPFRALGKGVLIPLEYGDKRLDSAFGKCRG